MSVKISVKNERDFICPIFKFQKKEHASVMWEHGNIHLSNASEFRFGQFGGLIDGDREGQVSLYCPVDKEANYKFQHKQRNISLDNAFLYCGSYDFFSKTLKWAISEGKDACVLITDFDAVANMISAAVPELTYVGARPCIYSGRDIGILELNSALRNDIDINYMLTGWVKPIRHANQNEFRAIWRSAENVAAEKFINRNASIQDYLLPVEFDGMDALFKDEKPHTVGVRVVKGEGKGDAWFDLKYPLETFTPVIYRNDDGYLLGFLSPFYSAKYSGRFHGASFGVRKTNDGMIACSVPLEDIVRIEYRVNA